MIGIYKITNTVNNKAYIGQSVDINRRWGEHRRNIGSNKNPLYLDFKKYGLDNFLFEVIEECDFYDLDEREEYWINYYNSYNNGYNLTLGGQTSPITSKVYYDLLNKQQKFKGISSKQWKLYYYLFIKANFNEEGNYYFLSRKALNISEVCRTLKIKSTQTFYNTIKRLKEKQLVEINDEGYILSSVCLSIISQNNLKKIVNYSVKNDIEIDLVRTYLLLKQFKELDSDYRISKRQIVLLLGHNDKDSKSYKDIDKYFEMLQFLKLVEFETYNVQDLKLGNYTKYYIKNIV